MEAVPLPIQIIVAITVMVALAMTIVWIGKRLPAMAREDQKIRALDRNDRTFDISVVIMIGLSVALVGTVTKTAEMFQQTN